MQTVLLGASLSKLMDKEETQETVNGRLGNHHQSNSDTQNLQEHMCVYTSLEMYM